MCDKCDGRGHINAFRHIEGGICFRCAGTGKARSTRKAPTQQASKYTTHAYLHRVSALDDKYRRAYAHYKDDARMGKNYSSLNYAEVDAKALAEKDGIWITL